MIIGTVILLSSALLNMKPAPVFADIHIGANGPYRFLVDTGAETSLIDPELAATLRLKPEFRRRYHHGEQQATRARHKGAKPSYRSARAARDRAGLL